VVSAEKLGASLLILNAMTDLRIRARLSTHGIPGQGRRPASESPVQPRSFFSFPFGGCAAD
jgi:hypothetical protein